jgi:two-component system, OmpR family, response regulator ArlR
LKNKILVIEDDRRIARFVEIDLQQEGYRVEIKYDGRSGLKHVEEFSPDIVLLDVMLPEINGMEVCRRIRQFSSVPVIMITAKNEVMDKVMGLDIGANDYITKPFAIEELLARIRVWLRNTDGNAIEGKQMSIADLDMNTSKHQVTRNAENITLTKKEYDLLEYLLRNKEIVLTRDQIVENVWDYEYEGDTNVVDVYIRYLRAKVDDKADIKLIHTVRGVGYVLKEANDEK